MCYDAKSSATGFWIISFMSLMIWYRGQSYDRALAIFILFLGMIQLVEFTIHSGASGSESAKWIFMILWLQILSLTIGVYVYTNDGWLKWVALILMVYGVCLFFAGIYYTQASTFDAKIGSDGHVIWSRNDGSLMGNVLGPLYVAGLFLPLIVLWINYGLNNISPLILLFYGSVSAVYVMSRYGAGAFSSMWCYLAVGFVFLQWFMGIFSCSGSSC